MADDLQPAGIDATPTFGVPTVVNVAQGIFATGKDFSVAFGQPALRAFAVNITDNSGTTGEVNVAWTISAQASGSVRFWSFRIYIREVGHPEWLMIYESFDPALSQNYDVYQFANGVQQEVKVVETTVTPEGSLLEGTFGEATVTPDGGSSYWLIDPVDPANNIELNHVSGDEFSDNYEKATYYLIGRGNKTDIGNRIGRTGSLKLHLHPATGYTVRQQWIDIEVLRNTKREIFIRNPFGDVTKCVIDDVSFTRVPGTGLTEVRDATLTYTEVA